MRTRTASTVAMVIGLAVALAGCGGDDGGETTTGGGTGQDLATVSVTVAAGAGADAEADGGDALDDVTVGDPAAAVCTTGERIGVIAETVDEDSVEAWTNATEKPVVFFTTDAVEGDVTSLGACSVAYEEDELTDTLLHGQHLHNAHSGKTF